jgi:hypothetical protein
LDEISEGKYRRVKRKTEGRTLETHFSRQKGIVSMVRKDLTKSRK